MKLSDKSVCAVLLCGGKGLRSKAVGNKCLCYFGAKSALELCLDAFAPIAGRIVVVAAREDFERVSQIVDEGAQVVLGGQTRSESVKNGLNALGGDGIVLIHDVARPFVSREVIESCVEAARKFGSGIAACPMADSVGRVAEGDIVERVPREGLFCLQTPQAFRLADIKRAYALADRPFDDDSAVFAAAGLVPHVVLSPSSNRKITYPEDLIACPPCQRIGSGIDFHALGEGRRLVLGGVEIPFPLGLVGHSDADALVHAIMDALLSACGEPDIGVLFPSTDEFKDADSLVLLRSVLKRVRAKGLAVVNVSAVIMAQAPVMRPFIADMRRNIAAALQVDVGRVNVSATTTEGLGVIGQGLGIAASAVCLLA